MAAMRELQQLAEVNHHQGHRRSRSSFEDARGQRSYPLDGKTVKVTVAGAEVSAKSQWDKAVLKQEFSTAHEQADADAGTSTRTAGWCSWRKSRA